MRQQISLTAAPCLYHKDGTKECKRSLK